MWDKIKNKSLSIHPTYASQKKLFHMVSIAILSSSLLKERWGDSMFRTLNKITWSGHSILNKQKSPVLTVKKKIPRERNEIKTRLSGHQQQHKRNGNKREKKLCCVHSLHIQTVFVALKKLTLLFLFVKKITLHETYPTSFLFEIKRKHKTRIGLSIRQ